MFIFIYFYLIIILIKVLMGICESCCIYPKPNYEKKIKHKKREIPNKDKKPIDEVPKEENVLQNNDENLFEEEDSERRN